MLFRNNYGVDLGSSSVKVYSFFRNKTYIEKNMVAYRGRRILAIGNEAYEMFEKSPSDISVDSPMAFGMLANLELQEIVLYSMLKKIDHTSGLGADMFFSVPLDMTAIEKRAYYHLVNGHWLRKNRVFMVESPIADAVAMNINLEKNEGSMVVNIGAQSTEFSILTDGKIIISRKIPLGGRQMNESICSEIRKHYNLQIGTRTAKRLKVVMGRLNDQKKEARKVVGIDSVSGLPREEVVSAYVVHHHRLPIILQKREFTLPVAVLDFHISTTIWQVIQDLPLIFLICTKLLLYMDWKRSFTTENCADGLSL